MEFENQVKSVKRITMPHRHTTALPPLHIGLRLFDEFVHHKPMNNFKKTCPENKMTDF